MILSIDKKEKIVYGLKENFKIALSVVVASLNGVKANSVNNLRKSARDFGVCLRVVPNSLLRRAVAETAYECLSEFFIGESIVAFSTDKPSDAAQVFIRFSKDCENFKIKGASFEGKLIKSDQVNLLSNLIDYKESILKFILILQMISVGNLMRILKVLSNCKNCL